MQGFETFGAKVSSKLQLLYNDNVTSGSSKCDLRSAAKSLNVRQCGNSVQQDHAVLMNVAAGLSVQRLQNANTQFLEGCDASGGVLSNTCLRPRG